MSERRERLTQTYKRVMGTRLMDIAWRPLTCDTPYVVENRAEMRLRYSGAVHLWFERDTELFLTWSQLAPCTLITSTEEDRWKPRALDRIMTIHDEPWSTIVGATLLAVDLLVCPFECPGGEVSLRTSPVGVRHWLHLGAATHQLWVGTGNEDGISEGDDLWIGLDQAPPNWQQLELLETIRAQMSDLAKIKLSRLREIGWSLWDPICLREVSGGDWRDGGACADEYDSYDGSHCRNLGAISSRVLARRLPTQRGGRLDQGG